MQQENECFDAILEHVHEYHQLCMTVEKALKSAFLSLAEAKYQMGENRLCQAFYDKRMSCLYEV
jgi:hypothetical protein